MEVGPSSNLTNSSAQELDNSSPKSSAELGLLALRLASCGRGLRELIQSELASAELTELDFLLLCLVESSDGAAQHQKILSARMAVSPARLSALVESLRQRELIEVQRHPKDRRRQILALSATGREKMNDASLLLQPTADQLSLALSNHRIQELESNLDVLQLQVIDVVANATSTTSATSSQDNSSPRNQSSQRRAA